MSLRTVKCEGCKKELSSPAGSFRYGISITASVYCRHCNASHADGRGRAWWFCSYRCLLRVQECSYCQGLGLSDDGEHVCPNCQGRKVVVG